MLRHILFILLLACFLASEAQLLPSRRYTTADGLVSDRQSCTLQDEQGFLWFGSFFGLSRYDGYQFTTITLPPSQQNKYVSALASAHGCVYAGFWFGGGLMEYCRGRARAYALPPYRADLPNDVHALCPHPKKGVLVAGSDNGIYHFSDERFRLLFRLDSSFTGSNLTSLAIDKHGRIWAGNEKGLAVFNPEGRETVLSRDAVIHIAAGKETVQVLSRQGREEVLRHFSLTDPKRVLSQQSFSGMMPVPQQNYPGSALWLTDTAGRFMNTGQSAALISAESISPEDLQFTYSDRENNLWVSTHRGVVKIPNLPVRQYAFVEEAAGTGDITGNDSVIWATNARQLYVLAQGRMRSTGFRRQNDGAIGRLLLSHDTLWVSTRDVGICRLKIHGTRILSRQKFTSLDTVPIKVHSLARDAEGGIWSTGETGIFYYRDGAPRAHFLPKLENGRAAFLICIAVDAAKHVIWAGDNSEGILKIGYKLGSKGIEYSVLAHIGPGQGLSDGYVRSLLLDAQGTLWAGTRFGGIFRIQEKQGQITAQNASREAGLGCTRVTGIAEVPGQQLCMATCKGLYILSLSTGKWESRTMADGLKDAEAYGIFATTDGKRCYSVSVSGLTELPLTKPEDPLAPLVALSRITVLGRENSAALFEAEAASFRPNENSIAFQFAGAAYRNENDRWYKYRLIGYDRGWSRPTPYNNVNYASLPSGSYTFEVLCSIDTVHWSEAPARFRFTIVQPFYKSPWFALLLLSICFALLYSIHIYRLRQKLRFERLRSHISADLHDDMGSTLSSISIMSEGALHEAGSESSAGILREINRNTMLLMDRMDDIIWYVNPRNDSLQNLMERIQSFAASLFEARGIEYEIDIDRSIAHFTLPMSQRQHLYLILKEAINNLAKHADATEARIQVSLRDKRLMVIVSDNGKGFDAETRGSRNGLRNMKHRAQLMKAGLSIESGPEGTTVRLQAKIK